MNRRKRRSHTTHQVAVSLGPLISDRIFVLQVAFIEGRVQISIRIMRQVHLPEILPSGAEFTKREIGFRAKFQ